MDLIYGRSSDTEDNNDFELPTHLPDIHGKRLVKSEVQHEVMTTVEESKAPSIPIPGTEIILQTQEDIDEWINQRKTNWMKKISNSRPKEENKVVKPAPKKDVQHKKRAKQDLRSYKELKFNLNRKMIQRERETTENKQIIDFIKVLFDTETVKVNSQVS